MQEALPRLAAALNVGGVLLKHRLIMGPMTDGLSVNGRPEQAMIEYYRARARGGAALIECIPFLLSGAAGQRKPAEDATDPIAGLEHYMLQRGVATRAWIEQAARSFARRLETAASR